MLTRSDMTCMSADGALLTPTGSIAGDWSFMPGYPGGAKALQYDAANEVWPCHVCKATFKGKDEGKQRLLQHLDSPAHETKLYHCSGITAAVARRNAKKKPVKEFKTLSGFAQHVEAGSCTGGKAVLRTVVGIFENEIRGATGCLVKLLLGVSA